MKKNTKYNINSFDNEGQVNNDSYYKYYTLFNNSVDGFAIHEFIFDENNKPINFVFLDVNKVYEELSFKNKDLLIGKKHSDIFPEIHNQVFEKCVEMFNNQSSDIYEFYSLEQDKYYRLSVYFLEKNRFASIITNITDDIRSKRKNEHLNKILKALRIVNGLIIKEKSKEDLLNKTCQTLVKSIGYDLVWISLINAETKKIHKFFSSREDLFSEKMVEGIELPCIEKVLKSRDFEIYYDPKNQCVECPVEKIYEGKSHIIVPMIFNNSIYGVLTVSLSKEFAFDTEENLLFTSLAEDLAYAIFNLDVQVDLEEARKKVRKYYQEVETRNVQLQKVNEALEIKNNQLKKAHVKAYESEKLKENFLANISHEIRTPLNGILGFTQLIKKTDDSPDKLEEFIDIISNSGNQLLNVINNILDISKIESNQLSLHLSKNDVEQLIDDVYQLNKFSLMENKEVEFIVDKIDLSGGRMILCDEIKLKQVLNILINNAIKFTNKGQVKVGVKEKKNKQLMFYIEDTGIGIKQEKFELIFESFRQSDESNSRKYGGIGLGLAIAKGLVTLMDGNIWLESVEKKGTKFYFTLPYSIDEQEQIKTMELDKIETIDWGNKKILIVEDDKFSAEYLMEALDHTDIKVEVAKNGYLAIDKIKNEEFDLILMDIQLPGISGDEVTKQVREFNKDIPIIAQTAHAMVHDKENYIKAGCNDYISKPISVSDLFSVLCKYL